MRRAHLALVGVGPAALQCAAGSVATGAAGRVQQQPAPMIVERLDTQHQSGRPPPDKKDS
eukprot:scaffold417708_cov39-Prasinocladus_malaysianus.AAC.1